MTNLGLFSFYIISPELIRWISRVCGGGHFPRRKNHVGLQPAFSDGVIINNQSHVTCHFFAIHYSLLSVTCLLLLSHRHSLLVTVFLIAEQSHVVNHSPEPIPTTSDEVAHY